MIGTISPLVQEAPRRWKLAVALHLLGGLVGGGLVFGTIAFVGSLMFQEEFRSWRIVVLALFAGMLSARDFGFVSVTLPMRYRSVPKSWWLSLGPLKSSLAYGFVLGLGFTTVIPFAGLYLLAAAAWLTRDVTMGVALGGTYGISRSLPVLLASRVGSEHVGRGDWEVHQRLISLVEAIEARQSDYRRWNAIAATVVALAAIYTVVVKS